MPLYPCEHICECRVHKTANTQMCTGKHRSAESNIDVHYSQDTQMLHWRPQLPLYACEHTCELDLVVHCAMCIQRCITAHRRCALQVVPLACGRCNSQRHKTTIATFCQFIVCNINTLSAPELLVTMFVATPDVINIISVSYKIHFPYFCCYKQHLS